jgi:hypothetical protein
MTSRSPAAVARAIRVLRASTPATSTDQELTQWYLALLRQTPTWRRWPEVEGVVVRWPRVSPTQLELELEAS